MVLNHINVQVPHKLPRILGDIQMYPWFAKKGMVENVFNRNTHKKKWQPTKIGTELGLFPGEERIGVIWSIPAQQFLLDNLPGIVQDIASGDAYLSATRFKITDSFYREIRFIRTPVGF